ncbi:hypothetical protein PMAYCL1PPCAC_05823, partial [Pristionchus mayeri]
FRSMNLKEAFIVFEATLGDKTGITREQFAVFWESIEDKMTIEKLLAERKEAETVAGELETDGTKRRRVDPVQSPVASSSTLATAVASVRPEYSRRPTCKCVEKYTAKVVKVKRETVNKGRLFYMCPIKDKSGKGRCDLFIFLKNGAVPTQAICLCGQPCVEKISE